MHIDPGWVAAGLLFLTSGGGWIYSAIRNGKSQARRFGNLEGMMKGINERMNGVETSVNNLGQRIDNLVDGFDKRGRRSKKS